MCPFCIGTATYLLTGGGSASSAAVLGYVTRRKRVHRIVQSLRLRRAEPGTGRRVKPVAR